MNGAFVGTFRPSRGWDKKKGVCEGDPYSYPYPIEAETCLAAEVRGKINFLNN
jgi:hypothetical protein